MKKTITVSLLLYVTILTAQNSTSLVIDNISNQFSNISLPYWLKSGQTIDLGTNAKSVSIIEFTVNGIALEFSQVISLTSVQTVPQNKVWKIEGIGEILQNSFIPPSNGLSSSGASYSSTSNLPTIYQSPLKYDVPGTYNWQVPPGITFVCIEVWGGGGGGANVTNNQNSGGGGGGGYGYQCFNVLSGTSYTITVGGGGSSSLSGGSSSVGSLISASGGSPGSFATNCISASGGTGGTSNASFNIVGGTGGIGTGCPATFDGIGFGGKGGKGGNGGNGGGPVDWGSNGSPGIAPGGGGGGVYTAPLINNTPRLGGPGARGQVIIYW